MPVEPDRNDGQNTHLPKRNRTQKCGRWPQGRGLGGGLGLQLLVHGNVGELREYAKRDLCAMQTAVTRDADSGNFPEVGRAKSAVKWRCYPPNDFFAPFAV